MIDKDCAWALEKHNHLTARGRVMIRPEGLFYFQMIGPLISAPLPPPHPIQMTATTAARCASSTASTAAPKPSARRPAFENGAQTAVWALSGFRRIPGAAPLGKHGQAIRPPY